MIIYYLHEYTSCIHVNNYEYERVLIMNKRIKKKMKWKRVEKLSFNGNYDMISMSFFDYKNARRKGLAIEDIPDFELLLIVNEVHVYYIANGRSMEMIVPTRYPGSKETKKEFRKRFTEFANELDKDMRLFNLSKDDLLIR